LDPIDEKSNNLIAINRCIHAVGFQKDVRPYLAASNAFVLPSYREGVGMVLLEANAMDVPCIASDIIGCHDVVTEGENGELVTPRNTDALYHKMKDWVEHREEISEMAKACRNYVISRYAHENVKKAYYQELKSLAGLCI
jgi:glycosyltransferase involved in cell wall biosynthesis